MPFSSASLPSSDPNSNSAIQKLSTLRDVKPLGDEELGAAFLRSRDISATIAKVYAEVDDIVKRTHDSSYAKETAAINSDTPKALADDIRALAKKNAKSRARAMKELLLSDSKEGVLARHNETNAARKQLLAEHPEMINTLPPATTILESFGQTVATLLAQQQKLVARFNSTMACNANPMAMLDNVGAESTEVLNRKNSLIQWHKSSGPAALTNAVKSAIAQNDLVALSAAARAIQSMDEQDRPTGFDAESIANLACGKRYRSLKAAALQAELDLDMLLDAKHSGEFNKMLSVGVGKIRFGMRQRAIDELVESLNADDPEIQAAANSPVKKISAGMRMNFAAVK